MQQELFERERQDIANNKTYRAIRHDVVRNRQSKNSDDAHHPAAKNLQIDKILNGMENLKILELFAGRGNLTDRKSVV